MPREKDFTPKPFANNAHKHGNAGACTPWGGELLPATLGGEVESRWLGEETLDTSLCIAGSEKLWFMLQLAMLEWTCTLLHPEAWINVSLKERIHSAGGSRASSPEGLVLF